MAMRRQAGFSLIELMVSAALMMILMIGVTRAFTTQQHTYIVVDQVTEAQQNLRAVGDLVERDVRRAGFMVPSNAAVCAYDDTDGPDTLFVSNTDVIRTVFDLEDVNVSLTGNKGVKVTGAGSTFDAAGAAFSLTLEQLWVDYDDPGTTADNSDFAVGHGVIVVSEYNEDAAVACGKITALVGKTLTVNFGGTSTGAVGTNAGVLAIPAHVYELSLGTSGNPNRLLRDGQLLASDVEDFQITWFFDDDEDLVVDAGEMHGSATGTDQPWELSPVADRPNFSTLREVGVNLVTVTRTDDPNTDYQMGAGQATGNREASSLPSGDGKRRRVSSTRVRLRNVLGEDV